MKTATSYQDLWSTAMITNLFRSNRAFVFLCYRTSRGFLATDHVILNHGQVTWKTPELAPPLLTTTPHQREDVSALDRFNVHRCPTRRVFSGTGLELVTRQATVRFLYHSATAATATRWFLATDYVTLSHGQVTWMTPELAPPLLTTTPHHTNGRTFELSTDLTGIAPLHDRAYAKKLAVSNGFLISAAQRFQANGSHCEVNVTP
ncbi:uncharacterized protein TNCV_4143391 [Trichonephila clavipes]|nr:uncharacterized protein TNCV_4143391 [Trichonephila clavipes]